MQIILQEFPPQAFYRTKAENSDRFPSTGGVMGRRRSPNTTDKQMTSWRMAMWVLACLGVFLISLYVRSRDWTPVMRQAEARTVSSTVLPL